MIEYDRYGLTIIDNFLEQERFEHVRNAFIDRSFLWRVGPSLSDDNRTADPRFDYQCVRIMHTVGNTAEPELIRMITPLLKPLNIRSDNVLRVKANLVLCKHEPITAGYHVDPPDAVLGKGMTAIYYINTCNGATLFENGNVVDSVANRIVIFPNEWRHSARHQTDTATRVVINLNWLTDQDEGATITWTSKGD